MSSASPEKYAKQGLIFSLIGAGSVVLYIILVLSSLTSFQPPAWYPYLVFAVVPLGGIGASLLGLLGGLRGAKSKDGAKGILAVIISIIVIVSFVYLMSGGYS